MASQVGGVRFPFIFEDDLWETNGSWESPLHELSQDAALIPTVGSDQAICLRGIARQIINIAEVPRLEEASA